MKNNPFNTPNPYKVENFFYTLAAAIIVLSALSLLMISRSAFSHNLPFLALCPLIMGIILMTLGIRCIYIILSQSVFFLGRGEPLSLAEEIPATETGKGEGADAIKENLRHNSLLSNEPKSSLNRILYQWIPALIDAPRSLQNLAASQFHNLLASSAMILAILISWASMGNHQASAWMGFLFYGLTIYLIIRPLYNGTMNPSALEVHGLVGLILVAVLGPVLLPVITKHWIDISKIDFYAQSLTILILSLACYSSFLVALVGQMKIPMPNTKSCEEINLSLAGHPKSFMDQLEIELQKNWTKQIPNRRYIRIPPVINLHKSEFFAELLEESQPIPDSELKQINYKSVLASPQHRWIVLLDILGLILLCAGITLWLMFAVLFNPATFIFSTDAHLLRYISIGFAFLVLSNYCFNNGHILWSRIDFISQIIWIEIHGSYQSARLNYNNISIDQPSADRNITHIDRMTIRVWVSELKSMAFGKKLPRFIVSMHGLPDQSAYFKEVIIQSAADQNLLVNIKLTNHQLRSHMNDHSSDAASRFTNRTLPSAGTSIASATEKICPACHSKMNNQDIFCGICGKNYDSSI